FSAFFRFFCGSITAFSLFLHILSARTKKKRLSVLENFLCPKQKNAKKNGRKLLRPFCGIYSGIEEKSFLEHLNII
ncbi:MAG: hypothetical protein J6B54_04690, partial [Clostridia bacterium]|nr:hypothetical protein [Clostridia bacterium]